MYVVYRSTNEILKQIELYHQNDNIDIIPEKCATQVEYVTASYKFKECKDFVKKIVNVSDYKEILFDGSMNSIFVLFQNDIESFWSVRIGLNKMITSYYPSKHDNKYKKVNYAVFIHHNDSKVLIGIADTFFQVQKLIETSCGSTVIIDSHNDRDETVIHSNDGVKYIVKPL